MALSPLRLRPGLPPAPATLGLLALVLTAAAPARPGVPEAAPAPVLQEPAADARAATVRDREGLAWQRPVGEERWRIVEEGEALEPGAWVRTALRGANALDLELAGGTLVLLGPGGRAEIASGERFLLLAGEAEILPPAGGAVEVEDGRGGRLELRERAVLRAGDEGLRRLAQDPGWLRGWKEHAPTEALGSLLARVDGRNVPLTIGYHKVTVDLRGQVARTVVEQSFRNHTNQVLEGTFVFPLPAGASISSFSMWVGDRRVEGEIVEKQRARRIYETILREKRDPGLLEWSGGNLFRARVYPIGSEKRIRLSYTQVLPRRGAEVVYRYGLQSELLRSHPLERLEFSLTLQSDLPVEEVRCPTHAVRLRTTEHAASVEYSATEVTPDRDLELRIRTAPAPPLRSAHHVRAGEEGYFLLFLEAPPAPPAADPVPPLDLLVLADTSGSLQGPAREEQERFVEALLGSLGPRDRFRLWSCDLEPRPWRPDPVAASPESVASALAFLEEGRPLGWTDLRAAFAAAFEAAGPGTAIVYVGDGIPTAGDADAGALAQWLRSAFPGRGSVHAVATGSSYEPIVFDALASLGGGSRRETAASGGAAAAARDLLQELSSPGWKELDLRIEGPRVAAVHPGRLPNLAAGTGLQVAGRFDPLGPREGEAVLTGVRDGERFELRLPLDFRGDGELHSYLPRLWARRHLDHLLSLPASPGLQQAVVALSEEFQILSPYASFLILESEADRERFAVERRFRMRDGEDFFAAGRADARFALLREQAREAKRWRLGLQARLLEGLSGLGREAMRSLPWEIAGGGGGALGLYARGRKVGYRGPSDTVPPGGGLPLREAAKLGVDLRSPGAEAGAALHELGYAGGEEEDLARLGQTLAFDSEGFGPPREAAGEWSLDFQEEVLEEKAFEPAPAVRAPATPAPPGTVGRPSPGLDRLAGFVDDGASFSGPAAGRRIQVPAPGPPLASFFPALPVAEALPAPEIPEGWQELVEALDRSALLRGPGAWRLVLTAAVPDARGEEHRRTREERLRRGGDWIRLARSAPGSAGLVDWALGQERGRLNDLWGTGRVRSRGEGDVLEPLFPEWEARSLARSLQGMRLVERRERADGAEVWRFASRSGQGLVRELVVDRPRGLLLEDVWKEASGMVRSRLTAGAFFEAGGAWWPGELQAFDADGRLQSLYRLQVETGEEAWSAALEKLAAWRSACLVLEGEDPAPGAARGEVEAGTPRPEALWVLLLESATRARWEEAEPFLAELARLWAGRPAYRALGLEWLELRRRREELRHGLLDLARDLASGALPAAGFGGSAGRARAEWILERAGVLDPGRETLEVLDALDAFLLGLPEEEGAGPLRVRRRAAALEALERRSEALDLRLGLTASRPGDVEAWREAAAALVRLGRRAEALDLLDRALGEAGPWDERERLRLRRDVAEVLWGWRRYREFLERLETWCEDGLGAGSGDLLDRGITALVFLDREEEARRRVHAWLTQHRLPRPEGLAREELQAALNQALGRGFDLYRNRVEEADATLLAETALWYARNGEDRFLVDRVVGDWRFRRTPAADGLLRDLHALLAEGIRTRDPAWVAEAFGWLQHGGFRLPDGSSWKEPMAEALVQRLAASGDPQERLALESLILEHGARDQRLLILRRRWAGAERGTADAAAAAYDLFRALLEGSWSVPAREEMAALLPQLAWPGLEADDPRAAAWNEGLRARAVFELTEWFLAKRTQGLLEPRQRPDMDRRLLQAAREEARVQARGELLEWLRGLAARTPGDAALWVRLEQASFQVLHGEGEEEAATVALGLLGAAVQVHGETAQASEVPLPVRVRAHRCLSLLLHLLGRGLVEDSGRLDLAVASWLERCSGEGLLDRDAWTVRRLLVQDRSAELRTWLGARFAEEGYEGTAFAELLAVLLAEDDRLEEAAGVLEGLAAREPLSHGAWKRLAAWYQALDRREDHERALLEAWMALGESGLSNLLNRERKRIARRGGEAPPEMDPETPRQLRALLRKASRPDHHLWLARGLYETTKDGRLLEALPEAVPGHSAGTVLAFLQNLRQVLDLVQDEAALDRLLRGLEAVRPRAQGAADERALRLLEFLASYQAAAQLRGGHPWEVRALEALRSSFPESFEEGEAVARAEFLHGLGSLKPESLAREQLRQLRTLHALPGLREEERWKVSEYYAHVLWTHARREDALAVLRGALDQARAPRAGLLPAGANALLEAWLGYSQTAGRHAEAEALLREQIARPELEEARRFLLLQRLFDNGISALRARVPLAAGSGATLYRSLRDEIRGVLEDCPDEGAAAAFHERLERLFAAAAEQPLRLAEAREDLRRYAFTELPALLARFHDRQSQTRVGAVAGLLGRILGARTAVEFLTVRAETEPRWLRLRDEDFWRQHHWSYGDWRSKASLGGGLEERVLAIVLRALREEMRTREGLGRTGWDRRYAWFWEEHEEDFLRAALEVAGERRRHEPTLLHVASYLDEGLGRWREALAVLERAGREGVLGVQGRSVRADLLLEHRRFEEAVVPLRWLVEKQPEEAGHAARLLRALHGAGREEEATAVLEAAEARFRAIPSPDPEALAVLAEACLETGRPRQAAELYGEAITSWTRSRPGRGTADPRLGAWYASLGRAWSAAGETVEAVEAAAGAVLAWGPDRKRRSEALESLVQVMVEARDLAAWEERFERELAEQGLENPVLRKALADAWMRRGEPGRAARQYRLVLEAAPEDEEAGNALVRALDLLERPREAVAEILRLAAGRSSALHLYEEAAKRFERLGEEEEAERARTNLVEVSPGDAEGHAALARLREAAGAWKAAEFHWRRASELREEDPWALLGLARVLIEQGRTQEAEQVLRRVQRGDWPEDPNRVQVEARRLLRRIGIHR